MGQFTLFTGTITGVAGTLITVLDSILLSVGWTKPAGLIGTNSAAYLSGGACPVYLAVNDNSPSSSGKDVAGGGDQSISPDGTRVEHVQSGLLRAQEFHGRHDR